MIILKSGSFDNIFKIADVPVTPEERGQLWNEGIYMATDPDIAEPNVMQGVSNRKKDIKNLVGQITLPRIMYPSMDDIVEIDGHQYYIIHIAPPQVKKNPEGTVYLLDVETGQPNNMPFMQVANRLKNVKADTLRASAQQINDLIVKWNNTIDKINKVANPSTWPMQLIWADGIINERLEELNAQEQALVAKLDQATHFSPTFSQIVERLKNDLMAGSVRSEDMYDTIMFIQHNDPDALDAILNNPSTSSDVKGKIEALVNIRQEENNKEKAKNQLDDQERQDRIDSDPDITGMLSPGQQALIQVDEKDVDEYGAKKPRMPDRYFGPQGRVNQIRRALDGIRKNKVLVQEAKDSLNGLREFVGRLAKGERAKTILMGTERGAEIKKQIAEFVHKAQSFIRRYKTPVFIRNDDTGSYDINKKLLGTTGGPGNAKVAVVINHMLSVIINGLKTYASETQSDVPDSELELSPEIDAYDFEMLPQDTF